MNSSTPIFGLRETISYCYILPTICFFGIFGNTANLITLASKRLGATSYMYLRGLAVADLQCMIWVLIFVFLEIAKRNPNMAYITQQYASVWYVAHLMLPLINWAISSATLVVVSLTLDRYVSVCWPLYFRQWNSPRRAWIALIIAYFLSFLLYVPMCFELKVFYDNQSSAYRIKDSEMKNSVAGETYRWTREAIVKFIPIVTVAVLNILIIVSLKRHRELRARMSRRNTTALSTDGTTSSSTSHKDNRSLLYLLTGISILFFICKIPAAANLIIITEERKTNPDYQLFRAIANLLEITNQAVNFYVFCLCSADYRSTFLHKFPCVRKMHSRSTDFKQYIQYKLVSKAQRTSSKEDEADGILPDDGKSFITDFTGCTNGKHSSPSSRRFTKNNEEQKRLRKTSVLMDQNEESVTVVPVRQYDSESDIRPMDEGALKNVLASPEEVYLTPEDMLYVTPEEVYL